MLSLRHLLMCSCSHTMLWSYLPFAQPGVFTPSVFVSWRSVVIKLWTNVKQQTLHRSSSLTHMPWSYILRAVVMSGADKRQALTTGLWRALVRGSASARHVRHMRGRKECGGHAA